MHIVLILLVMYTDNLTLIDRSALSYVEGDFDALEPEELLYLHQSDTCTCSSLIYALCPASSCKEFQVSMYAKYAEVRYPVLQMECSEECSN